MIKDVENKGLIHKDSVLIEPTSRNTGIALAFVTAALEYKTTVVLLPDTGERYLSTSLFQDD